MAIVASSINSVATTVYASSGSSAITWCSIANHSAVDATVNIHVVPSGGTVSTANIIASNLLITSHDTYQLYAGSEKLLLSQGDSIIIIADADNKVTAITSYTNI